MSPAGSRTAAVAAAPTATAGPAQRLLDAASELFAAQGIRAVGVDQILRRAAVAKASLYSTYGSKDALVDAYLTALDQRDRNRWQHAVADVTEPVARALVIFDVAIANAPARGFRGCLYANAATEFPGVELAPVRDHRRWVHATVATELTAAGVEAPDELAHRIVLLYDGALVGSKLERSVRPLQRGRALAVELIRQASSA